MVFVIILVVKRFLVNEMDTSGKQPPPYSGCDSKEHDKVPYKLSGTTTTLLVKQTMADKGLGVESKYFFFAGVGVVVCTIFQISDTNHIN